MGARQTSFESDARRIVAAVNDVLGIPTAALEAGFIREILVPRPESTSEVTIRIHPLPQGPTDPAEFFIHDRRMGDRRRNDRRRWNTARGVAAAPRILSIATSSIFAPLTLTLSPLRVEREAKAPGLPLPAGEGWGEGRPVGSLWQRRYT